jgi:hypothetical protein
MLSPTLRATLSLEYAFFDVDFFEYSFGRRKIVKAKPGRKNMKIEPNV